MSMHSLIPKKKDGKHMPVPRQDDLFLDLRDQMNHLFDGFFDDEATFTGDFAPKLDVSETDKQITVSAELPGLEPDDIDVTIDHDMLVISGEKHAEKEEKDKHYYHVERSYGSFYRSVPLSSEVDEDKIDASFKRGVLKVSLPKTREAQDSRKHIEVKAN